MFCFDIVLSEKSLQMTQAQLDFHNMTPQVTQEQIDLQNQLEIHTADLITKPLLNDSPILFLDNFLSNNKIYLQYLQKIKHLQTLINLLILLRQQKRNMKL